MVDFYLVVKEVALLITRQALNQLSTPQVYAPGALMKKVGEGWQSTFKMEIWRTRKLVVLSCPEQSC